MSLTLFCVEKMFFDQTKSLSKSSNKIFVSEPAEVYSRLPSVLPGLLRFSFALCQLRGLVSTVLLLLNINVMIFCVTTAVLCESVSKSFYHRLIFAPFALIPTGQKGGLKILLVLPRNKDY